MRHAAGRRVRAVALACGVIALAGCETGQRQDYAEQDTEFAEGSDPTLLAVALRELTLVYGRQIESAADQIIEANADDRGVRLNALRWKINTIANSRVAFFKAEPIYGLGEGWVFTTQMRRFVTDGAGKQLFGHSQSIAIDAMDELDTLVERVAETIAADDEVMTTWRDRIEAWAVSHPIESVALDSPSLLWLNPEDLRAEASLISTVSSLEDLAIDVSMWSTIAVHDAPRQARWEAQLAMEMLLASEEVAELRESALSLKSLEHIDDLAARMEAIDDVAVGLDQLQRHLEDDLAPDIAAIIADERETILRDVERQRHETLEIALKRIEGLTALVTEERQTIVGQIRELENEVIDDVDELATRKILEARAEAIDVADYVMLRVGGAAILLVVLILAMFVIHARSSRVARSAA